MQYIRNRPTLSSWRNGPNDNCNLTQRSFRRLLQRAELSIIRFHDLRYTAATLMLLQGVTPKVVSERLGHGSVAFTMDKYAHVCRACSGTPPTSCRGRCLGRIAVAMVLWRITACDAKMEGSVFF